jgi:hypothetical protein
MSVFNTEDGSMRFAFLPILALLISPAAICSAGFDFQIIDTTGTINPGDNSGSFDVIVSRNTTDELNIDGTDFGLQFSGISAGLGNITVTNTAITPGGWTPFFTNPQIIEDGVDNRFEFSTLNFAGPGNNINLTTTEPTALIGSFTFSTENPFTANAGFSVGLVSNQGSDPSLLRASAPVLATNVGSASFSAVPEPSSALVLSLLGGVMCFRRRKA